MKLLELHKEFIYRAKKPIISNDLPIVVSNADHPIIAIEKWKASDQALQKKFIFESYEDRNLFLNSIFEHEEEVGHHATISINDLDVNISLSTKDVNKVTELDKEFARYLDISRRDLAYNRKDV